jgi:hypothetical protein
MKIKNIVFLFIGMLFLNSCELDNYMEPNMTLEGKVVDMETGEAIPTRQPDGIKIRLIEEGYENPQPYDFWAKANGTFRNTRLFPGKYKVSAIEGAFEWTDDQGVMVDLTKNQSIELQVLPLTRVRDVSITSAGGKIIANYKIDKVSDSGNLVKSLLLCHTGIILHENTSGRITSPVNDLSSITEEELASHTFTDEIEGLESGKTYYARVAVLMTNSLNRYNYSPIVKIVVE